MTSPSRPGTALKARETDSMTPAPPPVSRCTPIWASARPSGSARWACRAEPEPMTPTTGRPSGILLGERELPVYFSRMNRRWSGWTGRAFIGYRAAKASTCAWETAIDSVITTQLTTSEQGGVVREPA